MRCASRDLRGMSHPEYSLRLVTDRISIITLGVADISRAKEFYASVGFARRHDLGDIIFIGTTGPVFALYQWDELAADAGVRANGAGFRGVTLAVALDSPSEVDTEFARWRAAGATRVSEPKAKEWDGYSGHVADPDGHLWELAYNPSTSVMRLDASGRLELV